MAAGRELATTAMIFHETLKMVGSDLRPDDSALDELGRILLGSDEPEQTLNGVSVFLGCIITEQLGGHLGAERQRVQNCRSGRRQKCR